MRLLISRAVNHFNSFKKTILRNDFGGWLQTSVFKNRKEREHDNG